MLNYALVKTLLKLSFVIAIFSMGLINYAKADCTLTTSPGTDGRCFTVNGEYKYLAREEDRTCFTSSNTDPGDPGVGG